MVLRITPLPEEELVTEVGKVDSAEVLKYLTAYYDSSIAVKFGGLSIQHRKNIPNPWKWVDGLTDISLYSSYFLKNSNIQDVGIEEFCVINDVFCNTVIENIIHKYNLVMTRALWKSNQTCYKVHSDVHKTLHIPLITDNFNFFYFPRYNKGYTLEQNKIYIIDTRENHSFVNGSHSGIKRLHLVGAVKDSVDYMRNKDGIITLNKNNYRFD